MNRIVWVDYAKAAAIYMVVLTHTHCDPTVTQLTKGVVIPLFFFISGFLFSPTRHPEFGPFLKRRFRQLIVPYLWINVIAYIFWLAVGRHFGDDAGSALAWHEPLLGMALGIGPLLVHDIPLWSLVSFFMVEMIYYLLSKVVERRWILVLLGLLAAWGAAHFCDYTERLPLTLGPVGMGLFFYAVGQAVSPLLEKKPKNIFAEVILMIVLVFAYAACCLTNSMVSFYMCRMGNFPLFAAGALFGIIGIILLFRILSELIGSQKWIKFISSSTLLICGFHLMAFSLMKGVGYFGFGMDPKMMTTGVWHGLVFSAVALLLCLPVAFVVKKYFRFLIDK